MVSPNLITNTLFTFHISIFPCQYPVNFNSFTLSHPTCGVKLLISQELVVVRSYRSVFLKVTLNFLQNNPIWRPSVNVREKEKILFLRFSYECLSLMCNVMLRIFYPG